MNSAESFAQSLDKPILLFDGVCNGCDKFVQFIMRIDVKGAIRFASLQSEAGQRIQGLSEILESDLKTVIFICKGVRYEKSTAIIKLFATVGGPWLLGSLALLIPRMFRDFVYDFVAKRRYGFFGTSESCRILTAAERERFIMDEADRSAQ